MTFSRAHPSDTGARGGEERNRTTVADRAYSEIVQRSLLAEVTRYVLVSAPSEVVWIVLGELP